MNQILCSSDPCYWKPYSLHEQFHIQGNRRYKNRWFCWKIYREGSPVCTYRRKDSTLQSIPNNYYSILFYNLGHLVAPPGISRHLAHIRDNKQCTCHYQGCITCIAGLQECICQKKTENILSHILHNYPMNWNLCSVDHGRKLSKIHYYGSIDSLDSNFYNARLINSTICRVD